MPARRTQADSSAMNRVYWEAVATDYQREVTSVFHEDKRAMVRERIERAGRSFESGAAADMGCGIGKFTRVLAECFDRVEACDWAESGLKRARRECRGLPNARFSQVDLRDGAMPFDPVDFVLCVNVLLMPELDDRLRAWRSVANQVKLGGELLLVVPSHESAQMELYQDVESRLRMGDSCVEAQSVCQSSSAGRMDLQQGVFEIDGVRLKHYLQEEVLAMLSEADFECLEVERIDYPEDGAGGRWASWDWMARARRRA